jgi:hypothetical protein
MRSHLLLGLSLLLSKAEAKPFDDVPEPEAYSGFTVTVEYDPTKKNEKVVREFYEDIMVGRPDLTYYKTSETSLEDKKLPAILVRCNDEIVYDSYGRTPPRFIWGIAIDFFVHVLDKENKECQSQLSNPSLTP